MLSYRHHFHAGNFADVVKHSILTRILLALHKKETPFRFVDTHAGAGLYDLTEERAQKNREYEAGITRVLARTDVPELLVPYVEAVKRENTGDLSRYPGSPQIARHLLRDGDRMVVTDLNEAEYGELKKLYLKDRQVTVALKDGYESLRAYLPPPERRGVVLIDAAFDEAGEFERLVQGLATAHRRWETGIYVIWYPLMDAGSMRDFEKDLVYLGIKKILQLQLEIASTRAKGLRGCGLFVVNPPWKLDEEAKVILEWLAPVLAQGDGHAASVRWLVPE